MPEPTESTTPQAPAPTPAAAAPAPEPRPSEGATPTTTPPTKPEGVSDAEWAALGDPGKAALVRVRAEAAASAAEAARLRKEIEDGKKTAEQRAADDLKAAQRLAEESAAKALRYEIAAEKGIPLTAAGRLTGTTREELLADADALKALLGTTAAGPRPDLSQSATREPGQKGSPEADFAAFLESQLG